MLCQESALRLLGHPFSEGKALPSYLSSQLMLGLRSAVLPSNFCVSVITFVFGSRPVQGKTATCIVLNAALATH